MAITRLSTAARNASANSVAALVDADAGAGTLKIYTGATPANGDTEGSGTLLATVAFAVTSFGAASGGVVTATDPAAVTGVAAGTAASYVVEDASGDNVFVGDVTATGGGGSLELATTTISVGVTVDITSFTYTQPAG
ncbi:hypothetical protein [Nocardioides speluncae]|uniref:hypothetical protein n=1 Tax=Nocardioides speluncae TaxID=2670337 RepID=UPI000D69277C|nr:hypothetical protein [Nocardioides speluncae]